MPLDRVNDKSVVTFRQAMEQKKLDYKIMWLRAILEVHLTFAWNRGLQTNLLAYTILLVLNVFNKDLLFKLFYDRKQEIIHIKVLNHLSWMDKSNVNSTRTF